MTTNQKRGVWVIVLGIGIAIISLLLPMGGHVDGENRIQRNEYGEGDIEVSLVADSSYGESEIIYNIPERIYTKEEIEGMLPEFIENLENEARGENASMEQISMDMNLTEEIKGYPFIVTWYADSYEYIGTDGKIKEGIEEATPVVLTAEIEYEDYSYQHNFSVVLVPESLSSSEYWLKTLVEALENAQESSRQEKFLSLPKEINGEDVKWKEKHANPGVKIAGLCGMVGVLLCFADLIEKKEQDKKRKQEIQREYPEFAMKCAMLIGSGMTLRQAFERIAKSYISSKNYTKALYEEVLIGVRELQSGVSERLVYEGFGRRCGIRETERFGNLMSRNLRKGSDGLKDALREEAIEAMEMHKETIRRQGETAGTKLLFPMLILLLIVMVMIMVPAFSTFSI